MDLRRSRYGATMCFELHVKSFSGYNNVVMSTKGTGKVVAQPHNHHLFTLSIQFSSIGTKCVDSRFSCDVIIFQN